MTNERFDAVGCVADDAYYKIEEALDAVAALQTMLRPDAAEMAHRLKMAGELLRRRRLKILLTKLTT